MLGQTQRRATNGFSKGLKITLDSFALICNLLPSYIIMEFRPWIAGNLTQVRLFPSPRASVQNHKTQCEVT